MTRLLGILLLGATALAHGASFDCAKARTPQEKAICASPELSKADEQMAAAYERALSAAPPQMRDQVRDDQRNWMSLLPRYCPSPDSSQRDETLTQCLLVQYESRTTDLKTLVQRRAGVTFVWRTVTFTAPEQPSDGEPPWQPMPGYGTLEASWPVAGSSAPEWQAWNKAVFTAAHSILYSDTEASDNPASGWVVKNDEDNLIEVKLETVSPKLVTAHVEGTFLRGAHPEENYFELNWLLHDRRKMQIKDVFRTGSGWERVLQRRCEEYLDRFGDPPGSATYDRAGSDELARKVHEIIVDPGNWQIDAKGISIVIPNYSVAPRMMHPGPVMITWSDLKRFLNPGFQPPA